MIFPRIIVKNGWTPWHFALGLGLAVAGIGFSHAAWLETARLAMSNSFATYLLWVPPVAVWLAWVRRERLRLCRPVGTLIGPVVLIIGLLLYRLARDHQAQLATHAAALVILFGCLLAITGVEVLIRFLPAFGALVFLLPMPNWLASMWAEPMGAFYPWLSSTDAFLQDEPAAALLRTLSRDLAIVFAVLFITYAFVYAAPTRLAIRLVLLLVSLTVVGLGLVLRWAMADWLSDGLAASNLQWVYAASGWLVLAAACLSLVGMVRLFNRAEIPMQEYQQLFTEDR